MPTNEQIIEAARRRMAQGDVLRIENELTSGYSTYKYTVVFSDRGHWTVTPEEAESVALESKQEHDHNDGFCVKCASMVSEAYQRGEYSNVNGAKLNAESVYEYLQERFRPFLRGVNFKMLAQDFCDHFAAPERRAITREDVDAIARIVERDWRVGMNRNAVTAEACNEYFSLQSAPEEADPRCSVCDHKDGIYRDPEDGDITLYCGWRKCNCTDRFHRDRGTV